MTKSVLLVGVGGQGTILASKLLVTGLMEAGYDVRMSEIHGMSQRGGSVSSHVRFGDKVHSPVIEPGGADILVAFEKMEGLRWLGHLKPGGKAVVNDYQINSMPILTGKFDYPEGIKDDLERIADATVVNVNEMAKALGNPKVMNVMLLGTLVKQMELTDVDWVKVISENVKPKFIELNIEAFKQGMEIG
jgi:indolepyruvate ferredoxin oxidoreductase beta subunit